MIAWKTSPVPALPGGADSLRIFDSTVARLEPLPESAEASMYVCGITPYDATHMGHAATYVAFDLLNRIWRDAGKAVTYVQNVTDIDDPLLERAAATGIDWKSLAATQTDLFREDMAALNVIAPEHYIGAVESIEWLVPQVERLVAAGLAYAVPGTGSEPDGDIYFSVDAAGAAPDNDDGAWWLGQVCNLSAEQMLPLFAQRGGDPDRAGKKNALDPLLWRAARDGEPAWEGRTLGAGRPGWHIECTVIAQRFLPSPFTVQGGGSDLIFPHHEMGAGHAFALTGVPMASHYVHTGMVSLDGDKMSKSRGNLVLVSKLREAGTEPAAIRLALLANHYRSDWSWTEALLAQARRRLDAWRQGADRLLHTSAVPDVQPLVADIRAALADDLNAPAALAAVDHYLGIWEPASGPAAGTGRATAPAGPAAAQLLRDAIDALLGVQL